MSIQLTISEFVAQNFDVIFQSEQVKSLEEAEEFLLGERHNEINDLKICASFVDAFANDSVVFKEGRALFHIWDHKPIEKSISDLIGKPVSVKNLTVYGWDYIEDGKKMRTILPSYYQKIEKGERLLLTEYVQMAEDWNKRTDALESSLSIVGHLRKLSGIVNPALVFKRTFLVAGCGHLKKSKDSEQPAKMYLQGDEIVLHVTSNLLDENRLHRFLNERKAVILFPKGCLASYQ